METRTCETLKRRIRFLNEFLRVYIWKEKNRGISRQGELAKARSLKLS